MLKAIIFKAYILLSIALLAGCYWGNPLKIPDDNTDIDLYSFETLKKQFSKTEIPAYVIDINHRVPLGEAVFNFPKTGLKTKGYLCNYSRSGNYTESFAVVDNYINNWQKSSKVTIEESLKKIGFSVLDNNVSAKVKAELLKQNSDDDLIILDFKIQHLRGNFCQQHHFLKFNPTRTFSGQLYLEAKWQLNTLCLSPLAKQVTKVTVTIDKPRIEGITNLFIKAIAKSLRQLLSDKEVYKKLTLNNAKCI